MVGEKYPRAGVDFVRGLRYTVLAQHKYDTGTHGFIAIFY